MARTDMKQLHPYQDQAADLLFGADEIIWVAEMGAGKTATTLHAIRDMFRAGHADRAIIFAPKRVAQMVWAQEAEAWDLGLDIAVIEGTPTQRVRILARGHAIYVVNYELAPWLAEQGFKADEGTIVVYDEVTRLKNPQGRRR